MIFFYQEYNSSLQQAKTDAFQAQTDTMLQVQAQQIQNLTTLIEKTLVQAAQEQKQEGAAAVPPLAAPAQQTG